MSAMIQYLCTLLIYVSCLNSYFNNDVHTYVADAPKVVPNSATPNLKVSPNNRIWEVQFDREVCILPKTCLCICMYIHQCPTKQIYSSQDHWIVVTSGFSKKMEQKCTELMLQYLLM